MLYNVKYRAWKRIADWWEDRKPTCKHWYRVVSTSRASRKEIEVSKCFWCDQVTSEFYVKGVPFETHMSMTGYGPVEACPITDDTPDPSYRPWDGEAKTKQLPNKDRVFA